MSATVASDSNDRSMRWLINAVTPPPAAILSDRSPGNPCRRWSGLLRGGIYSRSSEHHARKTVSLKVPVAKRIQANLRLVVYHLAIMIRRLTRLWLLATLIPTILDAQDPSGFSVIGIVVDPHQAAVLGARATLK